MIKGRYVYKNEECMKKIHAFYDKAVDSLNVSFTEEYVDTTFGKTHVLIVGDRTKPTICTIHGGNGINPLNLKLFLPLLEKYSILSPDVIGMPGKSEPYRNISSKKDEYGIWLSEVLDHFQIDKISFVVSSYSAAMFLSFAKFNPQRVNKALLLVPSGIAHGPILPMIGKMIIPFSKYYFKPSEKTLDGVIEVMGGESDAIWREFFDLMMSSYRMEMRAPKEYKKSELIGFRAPLLIVASNSDIFFPANKVFAKASEIFDGDIKTEIIDSKHLPSEGTMSQVCEKTIRFFEE